MIEEIIKSFVILFVILDPIGNIPIFISLTKGMKAKEISHNIHRAIIVASVVLFIFLFLGIKIFEFFRITTESFLIAGGIILLIFSIFYVLGIQVVKGHHKGADVASVPLGTPLITGPGTITTTIILVGEHGILITLIAAIIALFCTWLILRYSNYLYKILGKSGSNIITRIMGLILAAIAVQFIIKGITGVMGL